MLQRALSGTHTLEGAAHAYGTAFWVAGGLTALAILPCIVLLRAERSAREAKGDSGGPFHDVADVDAEPPVPAEDEQIGVSAR